VLYDRLVDPRLLRLAPEGAKRIYVGKDAPGKSSREAQQDRINALMIRLARAGRRVVRLKGGDPFLFGRGGEEGLALAKARVPFEVVAGVTAALGAAATTGIPFTHRGVAQEVTFATAHGAGDASPPWRVLGTLRGTIVFYMGTYTLGRAARRLVSAGRRADTPVAVVERATTPAQRVVTGTLRDIAARAAAANVRPPSLVVVGDVVRLRPALDWFAARPLFGRRVLNTRPEGMEELTDMLEDLGAEVASLPCLAFRPGPSAPLDRVLKKLSDADWVIFTSARGVMYSMDRLKALKRDGRAFGRAKIAAVGPATAKLLELSGLRADFVPKRSTGERLAREMGARRVRGMRVVLLRGDSADASLPADLRALGAVVSDAVAYRSITPAPGREALAALASGRFHAVTMTSGEAARRLHLWMRGQAWPAGTKLVTIGPVTSEAVRALGWRVDGEAASPVRIGEAVIEALAR
jgi:uroporphyrinogen III methyltransferase/synthase